MKLEFCDEYLHDLKEIYGFDVVAELKALFTRDIEVDGMLFEMRPEIRHGDFTVTVRKEILNGR